MSKSTIMYVCMYVSVPETFHIDWVGFRREWCQDTQVFLILTEQSIHAEVAVTSRLILNSIYYQHTYIHTYMHAYIQ